MICTRNLIAALLLVLAGLFALSAHAQEVPSVSENLAYLTTFSKRAPTYWGDDDHTQIFFFLVPPEYDKPLYIRVFDPDLGGELDAENGTFDSKTKFTVYGGEGAHSNPDARWIDPRGQYKSGTELDSRTFAEEAEYDEQWFTFGPYNPKEGEWSAALNGYVFKVIAEGGAGDDGNLYRYALSSNNEVNRDIPGGNAFCYEYSFRLLNKEVSIAHLYPFVDSKVISVTQNNFDFDADGTFRLYSVSKNGHVVETSGDNKWQQSVHQITEDERGKSLDLQIIKKSSSENDMAIYITNQYNEPLPFFAIPLGGPPKYKYKIRVSYRTPKR